MAVFGFNGIDNKKYRHHYWYFINLLGISNDMCTRNTHHGHLIFLYFICLLLLLLQMKCCFFIGLWFIGVFIIYFRGINIININERRGKKKQTQFKFNSNSFEMWNGWFYLNISTTFRKIEAKARAYDIYL